MDARGLQLWPLYVFRFQRPKSNLCPSEYYSTPKKLLESLYSWHLAPPFYFKLFEKCFKITFCSSLKKDFSFIDVVHSWLNKKLVCLRLPNGWRISCFQFFLSTHFGLPPTILNPLSAQCLKITEKSLITFRMDKNWRKMPKLKILVGHFGWCTVGENCKIKHIINAPIREFRPLWKRTLSSLRRKMT